MNSPSVVGVLRRIVQLQGALLVLLAVLASAAVLTYRSADDGVRRSQEALVHLEALRGEVLSAETGLRGYALTGQEPFLAPYNAAFPTIAHELAAITDAAPPSDDAAIRELATTIDDWRRNFAAAVLHDIATGRRDRAVDVIATGAGKQRIDRARAIVGDLQDEARHRLRDHRAAADRRGRIGLAVAAIAFGALVATSVLARRRLQRMVSDPLASLADTADRFGAGDLTARADCEGVAEVERLAAAFNAVAYRTEATVTELRAVDRMKSEFVSVVSHELRTPLTSIRGSLGLLASGAMGDLPPDAAEMLRIAVSNTDRLVRLINDILDLERIEAGRDALEIRPCSTAQVLADAAGAVAGAAEAAGVAIELHPIDLPVHGDADRLVQAVTNLVGNAVKFSEPGGRVVIEGERRGQHVVLRVRDNGRGIPADKLDTIFERFQQVDASDARDKGGTGLGLAIVRSIAERHGGRVEVASEVGVGSTFSIVLPIAIRATRATRAGGADEGDVRTPGGDVVMLAEDDLDLRDVVARSLARHGIDVTTARTAQEAIARCRAADPAVLVLDVQLADGSGYEVVRALRQDDRLRSLPTVVYTVADLSAAQRDALRLGETVFLTKGGDDEQDLEREVLALLARDRRPS